jgi:hypothetical protein
METNEEKFVFGLGCALAAVGALCLIPFTRRRLAGRVRPIMERIGEVEPAELAESAGAAAAKAAVLQGGRRFFGF